MDFMALISEFVKPELLVIAVLCYILGVFLKNAAFFADKWIPFAVLVFGIVMAILYIAIMLDTGFIPKTILGGFIQGILCAALAVFANQLYKQTKTE